jgi:hypothetical protein
MNKRVENIQHLQDCLSSITCDIEELIRSKSDIRNLKSILKIFEKKEKELDKELSEIKEKCSHTFEYFGHSHNDDEYQCSKCGEWESR